MAESVLPDVLRERSRHILVFEAAIGEEVTMGTFIRVEVNETNCLGLTKSGECVRICPVNIFEAKDGKVTVREENEDECTLCNLCLDKCRPSAITIRKLYE